MQKEYKVATLVPWNPNSEEFRLRLNAALQCVLGTLVDGVHISICVEQVDNSNDLLKISLLAKDYREVVENFYGLETKLKEVANNG